MNTGNIGRVCPPANPLWSGRADRYIKNRIKTGDYNDTNEKPFVPPGATADAAVPGLDPRASEDCLFLDVFVPEDVFGFAQQGYGVPVLVWIYGGEFDEHIVVGRNRVS